MSTKLNLKEIDREIELERLKKLKHKEKTILIPKVKKDEPKNNKDT